MRTNPTPRRVRVTLLTALALTVLVAGGMAAQAQGDGAATGSTDVSAERPLRDHLWQRVPSMMPRAHARMGDVRSAPRIAFRGPAATWGRHHRPVGGPREHGALFTRWLERAPDAGPVAPGLVGRVPDGTEVRLHLHDGDPAEGGALLATLTYVAGSDDLAAFQAELRAAASDATHVVVDVVGRTVSLNTPEVDGP